MTRKENLNKYVNLLHNAATKNIIKAAGETVVEDVENTSSRKYSRNYCRIGRNRS